MFNFEDIFGMIMYQDKLPVAFSGGGAGGTDDKQEDKKDDDKPEDKKDDKSEDKKDDDKPEDKKQDKKQDKPLTMEDIQKMIQSETDKVRTEYSKKLKALEAEKEELLKEKMTEEEKRKFEQEKKDKELLEKEQQIKERELKLKAIDLLQENEMPISFQEFVLAGDEEEIGKRIISLKSLWQKEMQEAIEGKFKEHGRKPEDKKDKDTGLYSKEQLENLSQAEIAANWEKVEKSLAKLG
jgi:hypothetical protein